MSLRRVVGLLLLLSVTASSVEILFGGDAWEPIPSATVAAQVIGSDASSDEAGDECACLCACLCTGAQLVVGPSALPGGSLALRPTTAPPGAYRSAITLPSPTPLERPPLA